MSRLFAGLSAWASMCACVLWRRMDFRAVDACAHGCPWTLVWLRGACVVRAWLSCARSCCVCACGLMCVPGGPFCGSSHRGAAPPEVVFRPPARGCSRHRPSTRSRSSSASSRRKGRLREAGVIWLVEHGVPSRCLSSVRRRTSVGSSSPSSVACRCWRGCLGCL